MIKLSLLLALFVSFAGSAWGQTTLVSWNFPGNPDDAIADGGIAVNSACTTTLTNANSTIVFSNTGNGTRCASSLDWTVGANTKCFILNNIITTDYSSITFSADMRGNNNASPRDFQIQYRVNNGAWVNVGSAFTLTTGWVTIASSLSLTTAVDNQSDVDIRILQVSNTSIGGGAIGTTRWAGIDNIIIQGTCTSPAQPSVITGATAPCIGSSQTYSVTNVAGVTYNWTFPTGWTSAGTTNSVTATVGSGSGNVTVTPQSACGSNGTARTLAVTVPGVSSDNQNVAGTDSWVGHVYSGTAFGTYRGSYTEAETFTEAFGGDATCFAITSNSLASSIYTDLFSVKYRMNSTKKGLYIADMGSDDGARLTVDGTMVYSAWVDRGYVTNPRVLFNLNGSSNLLFEFYENAGGNQVSFDNLTLVLANNLSTNTSQSVEQGFSGIAISGDVYGALPAGITLSGTGYQWSYSTTPGGARTNITGATGATYIPDASVAPFNTPGTYYIYRNAILSSANNVSPATYVATNESNAATLTVVAPTFYSQGSGDPSVLANWKSAGGNTPVDFSSDNQTFVIQTGHVMTTTGAGWNVTGTGSAIQVNSGTTLSCAAASPVTGTASLTLASGATIEIGSADGISSTASTGSIQVTGVRTFSTGANYTYNNIASQVTGDQLPATVNNLTFSNGGTKTLQSNASVVGDLIVTGSTLDLGSFTANRSAAGGTLSLDATSTLLIGGTNTFPSNYSTNTLTAGSTVNYSGSNQSVANQPYSNLIISGSGIKTAAGAITATSLDNGGTLNDAVTLTMAGNTLTAGSIENTNATIRFSGVGVAVPTGTVEYYGGAQNITEGTYNNLTITNAGVKTIQGTTSLVKNLLTVNSPATLTIPSSTVLEVQNGIQDDGTINVETGGTDGQLNFTTNNQSIIGTGVFNLDGVSNIGSGKTFTNELSTGTALTFTGKITGADASSTFVNKGVFNNEHNASASFLMPTGIVDFSSNINTVRYSANGAQNILPASYYNLVLFKATKTVTGVTSVLGDITSESTNPKLANQSSLSLYGNANVFDLNSSSAGSTISYLRAGDQPIVASTNYANLEIGGTGIKTLGGATSISGNVILTNGVLSLATNNLTVSATSTFTGTPSTTTYIDASSSGQVIKTVGASPLTGFVIPTGTNTGYSPITLNLTSYTGTGSVAVNNVASAATALKHSSEVIGRYWNLTSTGLSAINGNVSMSYADADVTGTAESNYVSAYNTGTTIPVAATTWTTGATVNAATNTLTYALSNASTLSGVYTAGQVGAFTDVTFYSITNGNWSDASTWSTVSAVSPAGSEVPYTGVNVVIGHTVTRSAGDVAISLGAITGTGTLRLTANAASTAVYPTFTSNGFITTGTVEYYGTTSYSLPSSINTYNNIVVSGGGTKTLGVATAIGGTLTLTSGVLQLGANDLTITNATAIAGVFSNSSMIETNSTGKLIRAVAAASSSYSGTYPVGSGGYYSPFILSNLSASAATSFAIRAVPTAVSVSMTNALSKYWEVATNVTGTASTVVSLGYNNANVVGSQALLQPYTNTSGSWVLATGASATGVNPATSTGALVLNGNWTVCTPNIPVITGTVSNICKGTSYTYTATAGFASYAWIITEGAVTSGAGTNTVTVLWNNNTNAKNIKVDVVDGSGFASSANSAVTTVLTPTETVAFAGTVNTNVCPGATNVVYQIVPPVVSPTWGWSISTGATQTPDNSTYTTSVNFDITAPEVVTLKVYTTNTCGDHGPELSQPITVGSTSVYAKNDGELSTTTVWNTAANGLGTDYTYNASTSPKIKYHTNGKNITVSNAVTIGGLIVEAGTLAINQPLTYNTCGNSEFTIQDNSTVTLNAAVDASPGSGNTFTMTGVNAQLTVTMPSTTTNAADFLLGFGTRTFNSGLVTYNSTSTQIIAPYAYPTLTLSGTGTKQLPKAISASGNLTIGAGVILLATSEESAINLKGNWIDNGTFTPNGFDAQVSLTNTTSDQIITENGKFAGLAINKSVGTVVTLTTPLTIDGYLNFSGAGILRLGTKNITLNAGAYVGANGDNSKFQSGRMIELTGNAGDGKFMKIFDPVKDLKSGGYFEMFAPIGNAGIFAPMTLRPVLMKAGLFPAGRSITVYTTSFPDPGDPDYVKRQWIVNSTFDEATEIQEAYLSFNYDGATELVGKPTLVRLNGTIVSGFSITGASNIFSFGTASGNTNINGTWTCWHKSGGANKYYSVKAGNWEDPTCWSTNRTTPAAGTQPSAGGPNGTDEVVICAGFPITKSLVTAKTVSNMEIEAGAVLDLQSFTSLTISFLTGQGTLRLSTPTLPIVADITRFIASTGGTIEYYGTTPYSLLTAQKVYNNLIFSGASVKKLLTLGGANRYTVNGSITVASGTFQFDDAASANVNLEVLNNITVQVGANFNVGTVSSSTTHNLYLWGNFTNNGVVRFTNNTRNYYTDSVYLKNSANGFFTRDPTTEAKLIFNIINPSSSQTITCNGQTDFYRINVDKGPGQNSTYPVTITASTLGNFGLYGINNGLCGVDGSSEDNSYIDKALSIQKGTLILGDNIRIYCLNTVHPYKINADAQLIIDGAWIDQRIVGDLGYKHMQVNGTFFLKKGFFTAYYSNGIELWNYGTIKVSGGTLYANALFNTDVVTSRGGVDISGGKIRIGVRYNSTGGINAYGRFKLKDVNTFFRMSGGIIEITDEMLVYNADNTLAGYGAISTNDAFYVASNVLNTSCTGGKVIIVQGCNNNGTNVSAARYHINSTAALQNIELKRISGLTNYTFTLDQNLTVNDSLILSNVSNNPVSFTSGAYTVAVGGNLIVQGASSISSTGLYRFNGSQKANQKIELGTTAITLPNVEVSNTVVGGEVKLYNQNLTISGNLSLLSASLNDGGKTITVQGNIVNSALHTSETGGSLVIGGAGAQCQISGSGSGIFGNLTLNRANGALTSSKQTINGVLNFGTNALFSISTNNLTFSGTATVTGYNASRYISSGGQKSDGGVTWQTISGNVSNLTFPVGCGGTYLPFTVNNVTSTVAGQITVKPSNIAHKLANATSLGRFWTVEQTGYDNLTNYQLTFTNDAAINTAYVAARIRDGETAWTTGALVSGSTFGWTDVTGSFAGDYTAGTGLGGIIVFTSNGTGGGDWNVASTWVKTLNGNPDASLPQRPVGITNCRVIITASDSVYVNASTGLITVGALQIADNARLDLGTTLSSNYHDFGSTEKIGGRGKLLLSYNGTVRFPRGDFGMFLGATGGTVEYYTNGAGFTIPTTNPTYYNLVINKCTADANAARSITISQSPLTVYNNLTVHNSGTNTLSALVTAGAFNVTIGGSLSVGTGSVLSLATSNNAQLSVAKDIMISAGASMINTAVNGSGLVSLVGNIVDNGTFTLWRSNAPQSFDLTFTGSSNSSLTGTGTATLSRIIVDKSLSGNRLTEVANSINTFTLNVLASGASATKPLVLTYGTYRHASSSSITLNTGTSTSDFVVNPNSMLQLDNGSFVIDAVPTSVSGANQYSGLQLFGKLKITGGTFTIEKAGTENYIDYSGSSGSPEIEVTGGFLNVGSQIRRFSENATGALVYTQSGGTVNVFTQGVANSLANRGLLEVVNDGQFNMSGGTLSIMGSANNSLPDFYIQTSIMPSVTAGGTINFGNPAGYASSYPFDVSCSVPLNSLNINNNTTGAVTTDVLVQTYGLTIKGDLIVAAGANFAMASDNLDLHVAGNLTFNGIYTSKLNSTYLNGVGAQTLTASGVVFNNLLFSNTNPSSATQPVLLTGTGFTVNNNLTFDQGYVDFQNSKISLLNNLVFNNGKATNTGTGTLSFDNASYMQYVDGNAGELGSITLNNAKNVRLRTNLTVHKNITFTQGYIDIDTYILSVESNTVYSGTPSKTSKIYTPGALNSGKVVLLFSGNGSLASKVIPVGAQDRYTPVSITTAQNDNGPKLEIKPIFSPDPYLVPSAASSALQYYWVLKPSIGYEFPSTTKFDFLFTWDDSPSVMAFGDLNAYQPACLHNSQWCLFPQANVNKVARTITFLGIRADTLSGDYTAGSKAAFTIIPEIYTSVITGNYDVPSTWDRNATPGFGDIIKISDGTIVHFNQSMKNLTSTIIDQSGTLEIESGMYLNNLGTVKGTASGTGTLVLKNTGMQDGTYDAFFSSTGGILEYRNLTASSMNITDNVPTYNHLVFNNTIGGSILLPSTSFEVLGNMTISAGTLNGTSSTKSVLLNQNFVNNGVFNPNNTSVEIKGALGDQTISGTGTTSFYNLLLKKNSGGNLKIDMPVTVNNLMSFDKGRLLSDNNSAITFTDPATYTLNSDGQSYAICKVTKIAVNKPFTFPVGDNYLYRPVSSTDAFTGTVSVKYMPSVTSPDLSENIDLQVDEFEHWDIESSTATNNFTFKWDDASQLPLSGTDLTTLRLVRWDGAKWASIPGTTYTGTASSGTIKATNIPTGSSMITFAALQKMMAFCPLETNRYVAPAISGGGTIVYSWTMTPANVGTLVPDGTTGNKECVVSFDGTNPNVWDKAVVSVAVTQNGTLVRKKSYRVITYPRTPALNLPAYVCDKTLITLQVSDQYTRYAWYQDTDTDPTTGLVTKQSGSNPLVDSKYAFTPDKVANGGPYFINVQTYYTYPGGYKECASRLLNPNKTITPTTVTPGGIYRYPNR